MINTASKGLTFALFALFASMQYQLWCGPGGLTELFDLKRQIALVDACNNVLRDRNAVLSADVDDLREGAEAVEEHARSVLGMVKQDEKFYQILE
ncbi:MAG: septum formation initiator family protein [Pseudomonadota bacterium]|nr:septum formation initiator family protein [Pseudomonadota bacterium]